MSDQSSQVPLRSEFAADPEMVELVQEFVQELPGRAETLNGYLQGAAYSDLRRIAHQLKGAAGGYGFSPISESAAKVENLLLPQFDEARLQELRVQVDELVGLCRRAVAS